MIETPQVLRRRNWLASHIDLLAHAGLEVGPYDRPIVPKEQFDVHYADYFSRDQLRQMNRRDRETDHIVDIDFVTASSPLHEVVHRRFDYVVASHVVEHIPDLVQWLMDVNKVLVAGGYLYLAVPDKRYTFDIARPLTTTGRILEDHRAGKRRPAFADVFDQFRYHRRVTPHEIWQQGPDDESDPAANPPTHTIEEALRQASRAEHEYVDCHCNVFTISSFAEIVGDLRRLGVCPFEIADTQPVEPEFNDFLCLLQSFREDDNGDGAEPGSLTLSGAGRARHHEAQGSAE
jgi:SAM-dependent methyltransferase